MSDRSERSARASSKFTIINDLGLHARAATKLVQLASKYPCEVQLAYQGQTANAKSVMGVLLLCGSKGTVVDVIASGPRASECVQAIGELIANRFGEAS
ncbi:MAG: HPr family phosphocarrier protein [Polyangiaceae bacterium]|nr:HPr family phosphocarrier protein [Polyangiaceae bacterium]